MRIQNVEQLCNHGNREGRSHVAQMLDAGLDMVDPYIGVKRLVSREGSKLTFDGKDFELEGDPRSGSAVYDLDRYRRVIVIGAAKGVQRCALALEEVLGDYLTGGHVIGKHGDGYLCKRLGVTLAGHPVPDRFCVEGCEKIYQWIQDITEEDLVITIVGSGVSSLLTWPIDGVTVEEMRDLTYMMQIEKGALTNDLNAIRNHLDRFKGGKISRYLKRGTVVHLATNDIGGGSAFAPGIRNTYHQLMQKNIFLATLADGTTFEDAIRVFRKYDAWDRVPEKIQRHFQKADPRDETVKQPEYEEMNARVFGLTPKLKMVYPAVEEKARELGYTPYMLAECVTAEAKEAGSIFAAIALNIQNMDEPVKKPCVLISSGELVVTVGEEKGIGGRNQEFCLTAAAKIAGSKKIVFGAVDTDGTDGPGGLDLPGAPECLCGAIVDGCTTQEAAKVGIDLDHAQKTHGASEPLWRLGCGIHATQSISALDLRVIAIME